MIAIRAYPVPMIRFRRLATLASLLMLIVSMPANAQFNYGGGTESVRSAGVVVSLIDFSFRPDQAPDVAFAYSDPAIGVFYSREGFVGRLMRGAGTDTDGGDLTLVEGSVDAWAAFRPFQSTGESGIDVFFPVGLHGDYRKVSKQDEDVSGSVFEVSVLALGAGAGLGIPVGKGTINARSQPFIGFASRSFGTDSGSSAGYMVDLEWNLPEISSRFGAYLGWGYRWQRWLLSASAVFAEAESRNVEYRSSQHSFQVGLTF